MKKLFSIVLAVVMVLSVASMAMAFSWTDAPAKEDPFGYKIEVIKYTMQTGAIGSSNFIADNNAAAVNNADVYFAIKLTVPDIDQGKPIRDEAEVKISFTALGGIALVKNDAGNYVAFDGFNSSIAELDPGTYYYNGLGGKDEQKAFKTIAESPIPVFEARCLDTETAKVYAKVSTGRDLGTTFTYGSYKIQLATDTEVTFSDKENKNTVTFNRDAETGKVDSVDIAGNDAQFVAKLYGFLGITPADVADGKVYMSDDNLKAAFGFAYKSESTATWKANSTPIILDPTVTIPKTGDNASVIGFAMIMVAVVAAAVAVKKVKA